MAVIQGRQAHVQQEQDRGHDQFGGLVGRRAPLDARERELLQHARHRQQGADVDLGKLLDPRCGQVHGQEFQWGSKCIP